MYGEYRMIVQSLENFEYENFGENDNFDHYISYDDRVHIETDPSCVFNGIDCTKLCRNIQIEQAKKGKNFNPFQNKKHKIEPTQYLPVWSMERVSEFLTDLAQLKENGL